MGILRACALTLTLSTTLVSTAAAYDPLSTDDLLDMSLRELMEIEVVNAPSLLPTTRTHAPGTVYRFGKNDFLRLGVRRLDELMRFVPGFQLNQYRKRHVNLWTRGNIDRYNNKMLLFIDGIPVRQVYYGHFSAGEQLPLEKVDHIEVILGPASSLYGANAFGGAILVTTLTLPDQAEGEVSVEGAGNQRGKGTGLWRNDKVMLFGSYLSQKAPFSDDRKSFIGGDTRQPLDETYGDLFVKGSPLPGLTLALDTQRNKTPYVFMADNQDVFIEEAPLTVSASYEKGDAKSGRVEARFWTTRDDIREYNIEQSSRKPAYEERQNATTYGARLVGFKELLPGHTVTLGATWDHTEAGNMDWTLLWHYKSGWLGAPSTGSLLRDPSTKTDDYGLFVQDVWEVAESLTLTVGGRYDIYQDFDNFANYRVGLVWAADDAQTVKLLYGTAHRTPTYREYQKVLEGTDFAPPAPSPEQMKTAELGYSYQWENALLTTTLFRNEFTRPIRETPTPDGSDEYFANSVAGWTMTGVETAVESHVTDNLTAQATVAWLEAKQEGGESLPYLAQITGSFNIDYRWIEGSYVGASVFYNSDRSDTNDYTDDDPGSFAVVNLHGHGSVSDRLDYAFGVDNVADARVYDPAGDFGAQRNTEEGRRTIWGKLTYRLP